MAPPPSAVIFQDQRHQSKSAVSFSFPISRYRAMSAMTRNHPPPTPIPYWRGFRFFRSPDHQISRSPDLFVTLCLHLPARNPTRLLRFCCKQTSKCNSTERSPRGRSSFEARFCHRFGQLLTANCQLLNFQISNLDTLLTGSPATLAQSALTNHARTSSPAQDMSFAALCLIWFIVQMARHTRNRRWRRHRLMVSPMKRSSGAI